MDDGEERIRLIARIEETQRDLGRLFAQDRSSPLFESHLTLRQLKVVLLLAETGGASGQRIAAGLGVGLATVTGLVDRLAAHGLVTRREDPADRRVRRVELTEAGQRLAAQILDAGLSRFRQLLERLDTATLRDLDRVMDRLRAAAADLGPSPSAHSC